MKIRLAIAGSLVALLWALYSYHEGGLAFAWVEATRHDGSVDVLRKYLAAWGALGPGVYVVAVIIEVLIAPIPGTLLYAPGGALFGGALGGTLSLTGNVIGAALACLLASLFGKRLAPRLDAGALAPYRRRIVVQGGWIVFLLRLNPLTSSDLVSYAAGLAGVPVWKVALGTLAGMAPLCYAQAYLADKIFHVLPGLIWILVPLGVAYAVAVIWFIVRQASDLQERRRS